MNPNLLNAPWIKSGFLPLGYLVDPDGWAVCKVTGSDERTEAIQEFVSDASRVYHETGLTPRELAEQRGELLEALQKLVDYAELSDECHYGTVGTNFVREVCLPVIARATGSQP